MTDTVTRLMKIADRYALANALGDSVGDEKFRQDLQDELTRLFTPLSDEQIATIFKNQLGYFIVPTQDDTAFARAVEKAHGIEVNHETT